MSIEKHRRRGVFGKSISLRDSASTVNPTVLGFINNAGTMAPTTTGTSVAGTSFLMDFSGQRLRVPTQATALGTASGAFGSALGGSHGQIKYGYTAASAQVGFVVGGTEFVMEWGTAGGTPVVRAAPAGA